jgi:hypothetical protein
VTTIPMDEGAGFRVLPDRQELAVPSPAKIRPASDFDDEDEDEDARVSRPEEEDLTEDEKAELRSRRLEALRELRERAGEAAARTGRRLQKKTEKGVGGLARAGATSVERGRLGGFLTRTGTALTDTQRKPRRPPIELEPEVHRDLLGEDVEFAKEVHHIDFARDVIGTDIEAPFLDMGLTDGNPFDGFLSGIRGDNLFGSFEDSREVRVIPLERPVIIGGLSLDAEVEREDGAKGFRVTWQGETFFWFPKA